MKVAIVGSRGIPNRYGGFEELAEKLAIGLGEKGHSIIVYNPHNHPVSGFTAAGVEIVKIFNPEFLLGTFGQFLYDLGATLHTWFSRPDIILQLGYTSSSIWYKLLPRKSRIITNMDGLEWMRSKYNKPVKRFLKLAEKWAAMQSHLLIADHLEIETYLRQHYFNQVVFIPYGAEILKEKEPDVLAKFNLTQKKYNLVIARFEPENHIEEIIDGHKLSGVEYPLVLVGSYKNRFGSHLKRHNPGNKNIIFLGPIYDKQTLNALRSHAHFYFHGHSVGGTNPSLLEAMACGCNIVAHKNPYNKGVLASNGTYFNNAEEIATQLQTRFIKTTWQGRARKNTSAIRDKYNWQIVIEQYELAMKQLLI